MAELVGLPPGQVPRAISALLRSFSILRPPVKKFLPQWDLPLVLESLRRRPYEPAGRASIKDWTLKTVFLLAMASARRRSEIHALSRAPGFLRWGSRYSSVSLRTQSSFLPKNQRLDTATEPIVIPALDSLVGNDPLERSLCPVRALRWYLGKTKHAKGTRLFVPLESSRRADISPTDISRWIVQAVKWAYANHQSYELTRVTAHEVRAISASWALFAGVSVKEICEAAYWRSTNTFGSCYLRDMAPNHEELRSLGPVVAAQTAIRPPRL